MQVDIKIDPQCKEPRILVLTDRMTEEISALVKRLSEDSPQILSGFQNDSLEVLEPSGIYRLYAANGKVLAETDKGEYIRWSGFRNTAP